MKKLSWIIVAVVIVAALFAVHVKRAREVSSAPLVESALPVVEVSTVTRATVSRDRHVLGTVIGGHEAELAPRVMAQLLDMRAREGDHVEKGRILARLDPREFEDAVASASAGVDAARQGLASAETATEARHAATARDRKLFDAGAISVEQWEASQAADAAAEARLEAARAGLKSAEKALEQARTRLGYCTIRAPFSGKIARRLADPGDLAVPGKPLFTLLRQEAVRIRVELPEEDFDSLHVGDPLILSGMDLQAKISRVFPAVGANHLAAFEADIAEPPPGLVSGTGVGIDVQLESKEGLSVPASALLESEKGSWVFALENSTNDTGVIQPIRVEILLRSPDRVLISGELEEGRELVVARPSKLMLLAQGMHVRISRPDEDSGGAS